jgi:hypothetical protein
MAMNGFRSRVRSFFLGKSKAEKPIIMTQWGPVSESARLQAAQNMLASDELKHRVEEQLAKELGSAARGLAEARRRYPEAYQ